MIIQVILLIIYYLMTNLKLVYRRAFKQGNQVFKVQFIHYFMVLHYWFHKFIALLVSYVVKHTLVILVSNDLQYPAVFRHENIGITIVWIHVKCPDF